MKQVEIPEVPVTVALLQAGFTFHSKQSADTNTMYGFHHTDGRVAVYSVNGSVQSGKWAVQNGTVKVEGKSAKDLRTALEGTDRPTKPLPPHNVLRAVAILGGLSPTYDLQSLRGDRHYSHRVTLLKKLLSVDKVLVKESTLAELTRVFHSALGVAKAAEFSAKCHALAQQVAVESKASSQQTERQRKLALLAPEAVAARSVPGKVIPVPKPPSKAERVAATIMAAQELKEKADTAGPVITPSADTTVIISSDDVRLLEDVNNGIVVLQLEKENSQGAICVYNNGSRVAAGVIPPETLKKFRPVAADLIAAANQLLHPEPSVLVTSVAHRHLTAVLDCKEIIMATVAAKESKKKFAPPVGVAKKSAPVKVAKEKGEKTAKGRTALYRLLNDTKSTWSAFKGQKAVVIEALVKAEAVGAKAKGITSQELYAKLEGKLKTNSTVERIAGFYLSTWQGLGVVEKYEPTA